MLKESCIYSTTAQNTHIFQRLSIFSHKNIMYVHKLFRVLISITKVTKYLNWFLQRVCLLIISPLRKNYNSISMSNIWQMGKHKACVLHCCLALLTVSAGCDPSRGFIWCRRQVLLTSLEKEEGGTRKVEAGGPVALVGPWRKVAMGLSLPTRLWPAHRICSCCYLKCWRDVNWMKSL